MKIRISFKHVFAAMLVAMSLGVVSGCDGVHIELPGFLKQLFDCSCTCTCIENYPEGGGGTRYWRRSKR